MTVLKPPVFCPGYPPLQLPPYSIGPTYMFNYALLEGKKPQNQNYSLFILAIHKRLNHSDLNIKLNIRTGEVIA